MFFGVVLMAILPRISLRMGRTDQGQPRAHLYPDADDTCLLGLGDSASLPDSLMRPVAALQGPGPAATERRRGRYSSLTLACRMCQEENSSR